MLKILPPIWFFIFLISAIVLHFLVPATHVFNIANPLVKIIGIAIFLSGMFLTLQASKQFKENNTEIIPTSPTNRVLITNRAYKFTRNPMYLGMVTSLLGIALYAGTLPFFLAVFAQFIVLNFFFIPFEEEKMGRQFGQEYESYKNTVRRWL